MKKFKKMAVAAAYASALAKNWVFADTNESYDPKSLVAMAEASDDNYLPDGDGFYTISEGGSIGEVDDGGAISWLFISSEDSLESLDQVFEEETNFCPSCGEELVAGDPLCSSCGGRLHL